MPIGGGPETRLAPALFRYHYAIGAAGVFYVTPPSGPAAGASVQYHDLASGATTEVLTMDKPPVLGLAISPDGRTLLYTQVDYSGQDLMLVEGFR